MIPFRRSKAQEPNSYIVEVPRRARETNRQWLARVATGEERGLAGHVLLLGGAGLVDFRIRVAQSHARQDMTPSLWSHVALLGGLARSRRGAPQDWLLYEVSLEPPGGFGPVPRCNGVQEGLLSHYDDPARWPNIAVLRFLAQPRAAVTQAVREFQRERRLVDMASLIVAWLGFVWGAGTEGNPLLREAGVPSAAFVDGVFGLLGVDVTPGGSSRASSPEAIWQAARWWHDFYEQAPNEAVAPRGAFALGQKEAACLYE